MSAVLLLLLTSLIASKDALYLQSYKLPNQVLALTPCNLEAVDRFNAAMNRCAKLAIADLQKDYVTFAVV